MRRLLKILYIKWILGACHNLCCKCDYKNECYDNFEYEYEEPKSKIPEKYAQHIETRFNRQV